MADCKHECCGAAEKVWLPYEFEGRSRAVKKYSKVREDRIRASS